LESLGETLFRRMEEKKVISDKNVPATGASEDTPQGALVEYRRLQKETADSREMIKNIETETLRLKEIEESLNGKEEENSVQIKELTGLYEQIGELVLDSRDHEDFSGLYRDQLDELLHKIESQETKLDELEDAGGGFFARLGGTAQSVVIKALLAKNQADLRKFYRTLGERFMAPGNPRQVDGGEIASLAEKTEELRRLSSALSAEIAALRGERRKAAEVLGIEGNPGRRIQGLEKHIAHTGDEIRGVCRRFGSYAVEDAWKDFYNPLLGEEDSSLLSQVGVLDESIRDTEERIEKLKTAIAIDEEKAEIEKIKAGIEVQRQRIAAAEEAIVEMKKRIAGAENHIEELTRLL
jgi:tetratricopeptide (TPR) repeat protein